MENTTKIRKWIKEKGFLLTEGGGLAGKPRLLVKVNDSLTFDIQTHIASSPHGKTERLFLNVIVDGVSKKIPFHDNLSQRDVIARMEHQLQVKENKGAML